MVVSDALKEAGTHYIMAADGAQLHHIEVRLGSPTCPISGPRPLSASRPCLSIADCGRLHLLPEPRCARLRSQVASAAVWGAAQRRPRVPVSSQSPPSREPPGLCLPATYKQQSSGPSRAPLTAICSHRIQEIFLQDLC